MLVTVDRGETRVAILEGEGKPAPPAASGAPEPAPAAAGVAAPAAAGDLAHDRLAGGG